MVKRFAVLVLLMVVLLGAAGRPALADSAPLKPLGRSLQPVESTTVRMESERIEIDVSRQFTEDGYSWNTVADVRVLFHFVPTADESMEAGFPLFIDSEMIQPPSDFSVKADGKELPQTEQSVQWDPKGERWAVWRLDFQKDRPLDLEVRYKLRLGPMGKTSLSPLMVGYILRTGRFWAGTIGRADAVIRFDRPLKQEDILPGGSMGPYMPTTAGWTLKENTLSWTWLDLEPDFDLLLWVNNFYYLDLPDEAKAILAKKPLSREDLLRVAHYTWGFLQGDGRFGMWEPLRGGRLSGEIGLEMLPEVLAELDRAIGEDPGASAELRKLKVQLLGSAYSTIGKDGRPVLVSGDMFRRYVAERQAYEQKAGPLSEYDNSAFIAGEVYQATSNSELRKLALGLVVERMPATFAGEAEAAKWVAERFRVERPEQDATGAAVDLLKTALTRVAAAPAAPAEPAPVPVPEPAPAPAVPVEQAERAPGPWGYIAAGGVVVLGLAAYLIWRRSKQRVASGLDGK